MDKHPFPKRARKTEECPFKNWSERSRMTELPVYDCPVTNEECVGEDKCPIMKRGGSLG